MRIINPYDFIIVSINDGPTLLAVVSRAYPPRLEPIDNLSTEGEPADAEEGFAAARLHERH